MSDEARIGPSNIARIQAYGFWFVAFAMAPIAIFSSKAMVPLLLLLVAAGLPAYLSHRPSPLAGVRGAAGLLLCLALWGAASAIWSIQPGVSLTLSIALLGAFACGLIAYGMADSLNQQTRLRSQTLLLIGMSTALIEAASDNFLTRTGRGLTREFINDLDTGGNNVDALLKNGIVIMTLLLWPAVAISISRGKSWIAAGFAILLVAFIIRYDSGASLVALVAGSVFVGLAHIWRRFALYFLGVLFTVSMLAAPLIVQVTLADLDLHDTARVLLSSSLAPKSAANRLFTWKFTGDKILARPVLGWGLDSSRTIAGANEKYTVRRMVANRPTNIVLRDFYIPLHPHNQPLQIWLELGAVGAAIVTILGLLLLRGLAGKTGTAPYPVWTFGLAVSILAFANFSFGAWQSWWIATMFLSAGLY